MLNKSEFLFVLLTFYALLTVIMGFIGSTINEDLQGTEESVSKGIVALDNITTGYGSLPTFVNVIIFGVFFTVLLFIIIRQVKIIKANKEKMLKT